MPRTYRVSRKKAVGLLVLTSVFVVTGFALVAGGSPFGWVAIAFFGLGVPLSVWQLIAPGSLTIDKTTIEVRHYWWVRRYQLAECGEFRTWDAGHELVVFDYHGEPRPRSARWGKRHLGFTDSLPDSYGFGAHALSELLNTVRGRAREANW
jgi:hypothetical protein